MRKSKSHGKFFIVTGILLILSSIALIVYNQYTDYQGRINSEIALNDLKKTISENSNSQSGNDSDVTQNSSEKVRGNEYIGIISAPAINLELPVLGNWDYDKLNIAPCRYSGSIDDNNLIIAAHNYTSFFDNIDKLNSGDKIIFTDINGRKYNFEVSYTELIGGNDSNAMTADSDQWDLTLFTCTWSGWSRVTVRAVKI